MDLKTAQQTILLESVFRLIMPKHVVQMVTVGRVRRRMTIIAMFIIFLVELPAKVDVIAKDMV